MSSNTFAATLASAAGLTLLALPSHADDAGTQVSALQDGRLGEQVDQLCINAKGFNFRDMTDRTVIIETAGEDFLVETVKKCGNLSTARNLYVHSEQRNSRCIKASNLLVAEAPFTYSTFIPSESRSSHCRIGSIYEWNEDALEASEASS